MFNTWIACAPNDPAPIHTAAITFNPTTAQYQISQVNLTTVSNLVHLQGSVADIVGGAEVVLDSSDPALQSATTDEQVEAAVLKDPGGTVNASFVSTGGVEWPADFHSENMVTTYFNFEQTFNYYHSLGWTQAQAGTPKVYYFPRFIETAISSDPLTDNAAFFPIVHGFLILPFAQFQSVPLPMNLGIIGHEYSHFTVNTRVYGGEASPQIFIDWGVGTGTPTPALNLLKALDEGFADFNGTGVTCGPNFDHCDPDFIAKSIPGAGPARTLSGVHCYDTTLASELNSQDLDTFTNASHQYEVGSVLSSAMWRAANDTKVVNALGQAGAVRAAMQTLYNSFDDSGSALGLKQILIQLDANNSPSLFTIDYQVANMVVAHATDPVLGTALCSAFMDRLGTLPLTSSDPTQDCSTLCTQQVTGTPPSCICACQHYPTAASYGDCAQ